MFLSDNQGLPLAIATPQRGNHHDLNDIQTLFDELCKVLEQAGIELKGVFLNANSGFDGQVLREQCSDKQTEANIEVNERNKQENISTEYVYFDELLYKRCFVIERMNA